MKESVILCSQSMSGEKKRDTQVDDSRGDSLVSCYGENTKKSELPKNKNYSGENAVFVINNPSEPASKDARGAPSCSRVMLPLPTPRIGRLFDDFAVNASNT